MTDEITLILTTPEAVMFRDFQQFHETFALLVKQGVFDQRNASIVLNFDNDGNIGSIQRGDFLYSRNHSQMQDRVWNVKN